MSGDNAALVHGSYDGAVYVLPMSGESRFRATLQRGGAVWTNVLIVGIVFTGLVPPLVLRTKRLPTNNSRE